MIRSMTAFASRTGDLGPVSWVWDMRGVNGRGLDLRLRLPDGLEGLEQAVRTQVTAGLARGNISISLRLTRDEAGSGLQVNAAQLTAVLQALETVQDRAFAMGVTLAQPTAADVLAQRGVLVGAGADTDVAPLVAALTRDFSALLGDFQQMRDAEGAALQPVITAQLARIAELTDLAAAAAADRAPQQRAALVAALAKVTDSVTEVDPARIAQELALIAVKSDITEEIDRLRAHVAAAQTLLVQDAPAGRRLDFLAQEFNREANTLCSKAQSSALTAIGLDLKAVIEQMREQIQNVE
ncbi:MULTISPECIES: YicC/YloC family endoribonuclease [unclassified Yoonia]|uniref:YicC/YloC family endoribonuclease n=1 Tax=unclassified Yoonia TaxID=2629118 RepID=UPI002AFE3653|nr:MULTISPECIES: YicC/YloC family endoribonuclease [unclassified Yoonia]